jgi:hypothetical protein
MHVKNELNQCIVSKIKLLTYNKRDITAADLTMMHILATKRTVNPC